MSNCDSAITEFLWNGVMESWQDDEVGSTDAMGWYGFFPHPFDADDLDRHNEIVLDPLLWAEQGCRELLLKAADIHALMTSAGFIVEQHSSGAVYSEVYATPEELTAAWSELQERYYIERCDECEAEAGEFGRGNPIFHDEGCSLLVDDEEAA